MTGQPMTTDIMTALESQNIHEAAYLCLMETEVTQKLVKTHALFGSSAQSDFKVAVDGPVASTPTPGRPARPKLVAPRELTKRTTHNEQGKAALAHSIAHIEFNAINLALDAVYRFRGQSVDFYLDWIRVAKEEAEHFSLLAGYLNELGYEYGDFSAHNGLWEMAVETDYDVLVRMALVPRVLEARGLDVTPGIITRFEQIGDQAMIDILSIIQRDEVGHVEIGTRWYRYFCQQRGLDPLPTFKQLLVKHLKGGLKGPYDFARRRQAGFSDEELAFLQQAEN